MRFESPCSGCWIGKEDTLFFFWLLIGNERLIIGEDGKNGQDMWASQTLGKHLKAI